MADNTVLYMVAGLVAGAVAVYIVMTQLNQTKVVDFTRDGEGRIITIVEKKV